MLNSLLWLILIVFVALFILNLVIVLRYNFRIKKTLKREIETKQLVREVAKLNDSISSLLDDMKKNI